MKKFLTVLCCVAVLAAFSSQAVAAEKEYDGPSETKMVLDIMLLRPFGISSLAAGTVFFVAGLPFSIITNSVSDTARLFIHKPFDYTFVRKVGEM